MSSNNDRFEISVTELRNARESGESFYLLDVRTLPEFEAGRLSFTDALIPYDQLPKHLNQLPDDRTTEIYCFCRTGNRSGIATEFLRAMGYRNARNVQGGIVDWVDCGWEIESGPVGDSE